MTVQVWEWISTIQVGWSYKARGIFIILVRQDKYKNNPRRHSYIESKI